MVDHKEGKGEYIQWRPEESKMLLELAANCFKRGWVDSKGRMFRKTVETKILSALNEKLNCQKTYKHYINRMKILKSQYRDFLKLLQFDPKFEWNPITKKFMAPEEVWNDYLKEHPNHSHMRYEAYEEYENMKLIFGNNWRFKRSHSRACEVRNNEKRKQEVDLTKDDYDEVHESMGVQHGTPLYLENSVKNTLTDDTSGDDSSDALVTEKDLLRSIESTNKQMLHILQTKFMVEEKKNNVWEAITEIPNLDNNARYKALTMIQKLGMTDIFINMSIEDRLGWIQSNTE